MRNQNFKAPEHLSHKPIVKVDNYHHIDGGDAKALSIGKAQYNNDDIAAKVWRKPNKQWSRQSEELPPQRVLDLAILLLASFEKSENTSYPITNLREQLADGKDASEIDDFYQSNRQELEPRIKELHDIASKILKEIRGK
jgi:hypothetical protein